MKTSVPGPEHAVLARLVGRWSGHATLQPSATVRTRQRAHGLFNIRTVCNGFFLVSDYEEQVDDEVVYRGHGVYGWEPGIERYTMFWFDSAGGGGAVKPVLGTFEDDRLCFEQSVEEGARRYVYELVSDDEFTFRLEAAPDGETWATLMDGRYGRMQ